MLDPEAVSVVVVAGRWRGFRAGRPGGLCGCWTVAVTCQFPGVTGPTLVVTAMGPLPGITSTVSNVLKVPPGPCLPA